MSVFSDLPLVIEPSDLAPRLGAPELILVDLTSAARYAEGHIPGARFVDPKRTQWGQPPAPGLLPAKADLEALFGELGHRPEATYVVYDDEGGGWAGRFIWPLDVIGHHRYHYLNGGLPAWIADAQVLDREVLQARRQPGAQWDLREFLVSAYFSLHGRLDEDVIGVYKDVLQTQDGKRKALLDELKALTAELKVYSVIQSQINAALSAKQGIRIDAGGIDLVDPTLYGYAVGDPRWKDSPEYALLSNLDTFSGKLSIKDFLSGSPKQSGELKGLRDEYPFEKDNNPVGNFATTVSDRSRPLNDKVNEKTTLLNDTSSRYNSAVEALNRFIQKYDSVLRDILSAI
ncbi:rhodanese-like domain-containing protein [Pseudomonas aeruginosa]|nr:rhodanese-like domain-containing protein [Pseudomonas aeruginosa]